MTRKRTPQPDLMSSPADYQRLKPLKMQVAIPHRGTKWFKLIAATSWTRHSMAKGETFCNGDELRDRDAREEISKAFIEAGRRIVFKKNDTLWWEREMTAEEIAGKKDES